MDMPAGKQRKQKVLILAKTYPSPSAKYVETSCVAGINEHGEMLRLYPVPFRMVEENKQFKKWQWIEILIEKANKDHRPESHKLYIDTITCLDTIESKNDWSGRYKWLDKIPSFDDFDNIESSRLADGISIALLRPKQIITLDITEARNSDWTEEEKEKLAREQAQGDLFSEAEVKRQIKELRKVPFDFHYRYLCDSPEGEKEYRHKIVDWEAGALFWHCKHSHGKDWEKPFRAKLETQLGSKNLMFMMGNQHRFQNQWLIISLIYPPKQKPDEAQQSLLF